MPDDKRPEAPVFLPDGVSNQEVLSDAVKDFYSRIEKIRRVENAYLDRLIADMEVLVSADMIEHVNASQREGAGEMDEKSVEQPLTPRRDLSKDSASGVPFPFPGLFPADQSLLEKWKDTFTEEILKVQCHQESVVVKDDYSKTFLTIIPFGRGRFTSGEAPTKTQDSGWYATLKQALFG